MVKCITFCVSCKSPLVIQGKPYNLPYKSHTVCHTKKDKCHTKSCTEWQKSHTLPYRLLYKMAEKPYSAIRKAILYGKKAIRCHTDCCTRWQESHTVPYKKPYCTAKMPYTKKDNKKMRRTKWKN